jgi:hypothetical protein
MTAVTEPVGTATRRGDGAPGVVTVMLPRVHDTWTPAGLGERSRLKHA